jgi:hypothetical protein
MNNLPLVGIGVIAALALSLVVVCLWVYIFTRLGL